ncbi:ATPase [Ralstonia solanacearum]|jgi:hypothetical protein|uniref:ATPase n=1 Tax=Ralstonia sp. 3PA37C10 TaxID=2502217 RepID=UPI0010F5A043|nr:ATPase [Ralstonia sp. 3PA37C10]NKA75241.1 ATPase [Ralstonia solanacearum]NKG12351.1 ATPase [Ralstonia solanacearum]
MQNTIDKIEGADNSEVAVTTNGATLSTAEAAASTAPDTAGATAPSDVEQELNEMEHAVDALQRDSLISATDADSQKGEVARTRKMFREMSPDDRAKIVARRRELGRQILTRQLAGASVVETMVKLNHTRLKPLFEQWWPFMNRMTINLSRFGHSTFTASELSTITKHFETQMANLEAYVDEQLRVAEGYRASREQEMASSGAMIWKPSVTKPSMEMVVEAYSPFAMRALGVLNKFDRAMDHFDFMVWNAIRDQSDVNEEINRFLRKFQPLAIRCYTTHLRLMTTVRNI